MLFSSITFLYYFLPAVLVIYYLTPAKVKNLILFLASFVFYLWGEPKYSVLLLFSVAVGYMGGRCIEYQRQKKCVCAADPADRSGKYKGRHDRLVVGIFTAMTLGLLVFFKYMDFLADSVNRILGTHVSMVQIALPVGISFYTFQIISYYVDVYRGEVAAEHNFVDFAAYVTMFPQLIAGPIVRFQSVQAELKHREITWEKTGEGAARFVCGLCKKVLIADSLATFVQTLQNISETAAKTEAVVTTGIRAEGAGIGTLGYWVLALAFMLQLYYDFSGYSDMAIGISWMLNLDLPVNFDSPYKAYSVVEFWKRWHISLTGFLTKYIYIPLGGSRKGNLRTYCNTMIVFLCSGIWHGASWMFVLWGALHGVAMVLTKALKRYGEWIPRILKRSVTLLFINFTWIIFRTADLKELREVFRAFLKGGISINPDLFQFFGIAGNRIGEYAILYSILLLFSVIGILVFLLIAPNAKEAAEKMKYKVWHGFVAAGIIALCILHFSGVSSFVYFNF